MHPESAQPDDSLRLRIRRGRLAQSNRTDPAGELEAREPEDLFDIPKEEITPYAFPRPAELDER